MITEVLVAIIAPILLFILYDFVMQLICMRTYPPGPMPYPIVGNLEVYGGTTYENMDKLKAKYGDVCSFSFPSCRAILINNIEIAREVLINQGAKVTGRLVGNLMAEVLTDHKDLVAAEGERWKRLRKMVHSSLQMFGYGMERLQSMIVTESEHFHDKLRKLNGEPIDPRMSLALFLTNVTCALMFGKRYDDDDPEFHDMMEYQDLMKQALTTKDLAAFLPWLQKFPVFKSVRLARKGVAIRDPIFLRKIDEHKETYDPDNIRDFTDSLIRYTKEQNQSMDNTVKEDIVLLLHDLVFAGVDTGLNSIGFGLLYLVHHPEVQDMIADESQKVLGDSVYPSIQDRPRLPVLHATIMEILRLGSVAYLGIIHRCLEPTKIGSYNVEKDTLLLYNIWSINHDERFWANPYEFNPKRWLNEDGSVKLGGKESFISFGLGRRNCVGETLAKAELFIFIGRLLKDFKLLPGNEGKMPSLEPEMNFILTPKPSQVRFVQRS